jgi:hypothetical protein
MEMLQPLLFLAMVIFYTAAFCMQKAATSYICLGADMIPKDTRDTPEKLLPKLHRNS